MAFPSPSFPTTTFTSIQILFPLPLPLSLHSSSSSSSSSINFFCSHSHNILMGYLSCHADSAIATCDPYNWDYYKSKSQKPKNSYKIREFSYSDLESATNGFSADNFLGKGSHGRVYRAVLDDGKLIAAVKKTKTISNYSNSEHNFPNCNNNNCITTPAENEIEILSKARNPRLVNLLGFSVDSKDQKMMKKKKHQLIVVEYMPNGSLYDLLHSNSRPPGWKRRIRFALHIAKAVESLHSSNPPVIHRDIKSSNVLIDRDGDARLGDFGLALRGHVEDVKVMCTPPAGTLGYLDPSYLAPSDLSTKSDVFSFGILLFEIISGRKAIDVNYSPPSVVDWAVPLINHCEFDAMCDRRIGPPEDPSVIRQLAVLAARCVRSAAGKRPTMAEVVEVLRSVNKRVHAPIWNSLGLRVRRVRKSRPLISRSRDAYDASGSEAEVVVKSSKLGKLGSRRNGKVSSVTSAELESHLIDTRGRNRVGRSRSIGSVSEIKVGHGGRCDLNVGGYQMRRKHEVAKKMVVVKLSKSRSMGVLQCSSTSNKMVNFSTSKDKGGIMLVMKNNPQIEESEESKLLVNVD